jgi:TonB family protein
MKNVQKLILATGLVAAHLASGAETAEQAYVASFQGRTGLPVPIAVVKPDIPPLQGGITVFVELVVDENGVPRGVKVRDSNAVERAVARSIVTAVGQWRFRPLVRDGVPVATRVVVPFKIVDELDARGLMVAK